MFEKNETSIESKQTGLNYNKNLYDERIMLLKKLMNYFAPIIAEEVINRGQIKQEDKTIATYKIKLN